jgi:hypothetical protein
MFWILWMVASYAGAIMYFLPVGVVHILLGFLGVNDSGGPDLSAEIPLGLRVLAAVLCGAACGSTIGLAHWLVLRTRLARAGWWVAATIAGYATLGIWPLVANMVQPGWMDWAFTLIVNGKMYWLARVLPAWPASSAAAGAVTYLMFGAALGIVQWLALRGRVDGAGWWIAISTAGWALGSGLALLPAGVLPEWAAVSGWFDVPYGVTGAGMAWLLRRSAPVVQAAG